MQLVGPGPIALPGGGGGGGTSTAYSMTSYNPGAAPTVGQRAYDAKGNCYIFCNASGTINFAAAVIIGDDHSCAQVTATCTRGRVGIAMAPATSDQGIWVQVYGRSYVMIGGGGPVSCSDTPPTTLSTTDATRFMLQTSATSPTALFYTSGFVSGFAGGSGWIEGMWIASDATLTDIVSGGVSGACSTADSFFGLLNAGLTSPLSDVTLTTASTTGQYAPVFLNFPHVKIFKQDPT